MQPEFTRPEFIENNSAEEIHQRMMNNLPADIDDMPGGFPFDFTMPAALEKDEFINYHMVRALMIAFPQYAWDEWLDRHGQQVHLERHQPESASGKVKVTGKAGAVIAAGTVQSLRFRHCRRKCRGSMVRSTRVLTSYPRGPSRCQKEQMWQSSHGMESFSGNPKGMSQSLRRTAGKSRMSA